MEGGDWKIELFKVPRPIKAVAKFISRTILGPHLFSPISDHEFRHPLDKPIEPVTDFPNQPTFEWPEESEGIGQ